MEKRVDEKILEFLNAVEKAKARKDIRNDPVKIGNRYYQFEESDFFDGKLKIYIPKDFEDMSEADREIKYSLENVPDIIKCNEKGNTYITLKFTDRHLDEEQVKNLKDEMKVMVRSANPMNVFYEDGVLEVNFKNIVFCEFKSYATDGPLCNLMFSLEFKGKALMGTFSCLYDEYEEWREIAFQIIKTIRVIKEDEGDEN